MLIILSADLAATDEKEFPLLKNNTTINADKTLMLLNPINISVNVCS
jgi:hypothetical protein